MCLMVLSFSKLRRFNPKAPVTKRTEVARSRAAPYQEIDREVSSEPPHLSYAGHVYNKDQDVHVQTIRQKRYRYLNTFQDGPVVDLARALVDFPIYGYLKSYLNMPPLLKFIIDPNENQDESDFLDRIKQGDTLSKDSLLLDYWQT